jgi:hypothetical protein
VPIYDVINNSLFGVSAIFVNKCFVNISVALLVHFSPLLVKGKAIPLQALTGPEDSRKLRFPDFKTIGT